MWTKRQSQKSIQRDPSCVRAELLRKLEMEFFCECYRNNGTAQQPDPGGRALLQVGSLRPQPPGILGRFNA